MCSHEGAKQVVKPRQVNRGNDTNGDYDGGEQQTGNVIHAAPNCNADIICLS